MASIARRGSGVVTIGVDPHPSSHTASAVSASGQVLAQVTVASDDAGHQQLVEWSRQYARRQWAVEGPGNPYVRKLVSELVSMGELVYPIAPAMTSLYRSRYSRGKDDEIDATSAAQAFQANRKKLRPISADQLQPQLKELTRTYRTLRRQLTANRMARKAVESSPAKTAYDAVIKALEESVDELKKAIEQHMRKVAPELLEPTGFGPITAAVLLAEIGSIKRFASRDHLASYAGCAPLPWSSGAHTSHRVNPGGNRHLNWAAHMIVTSRLRVDPTTRAYRDRKLAQGKTQREVLRLLKTYVCREIYRLFKANPSFNRPQPA